MIFQKIPKEKNNFRMLNEMLNRMLNSFNKNNNKAQIK